MDLGDLGYGNGAISNVFSILLQEVYMLWRKYQLLWHVKEKLL